MSPCFNTPQIDLLRLGSCPTPVLVAVGGGGSYGKGGGGSGYIDYIAVSDSNAPNLGLNQSFVQFTITVGSAGEETTVSTLPDKVCNLLNLS